MNIMIGSLAMLVWKNVSFTNIYKYTQSLQCVCCICMKEAVVQSLVSFNFGNLICETAYICSFNSTA